MKIPPRQQRQGFFVVGGTLRPNAPSYVKRPADEELPGLIRAGRFTYILTARQMGKSSLITRTAYRLRKEGIQTVLIDLTALGSSSSEEEWYFALLKQLVRDLRLTVDLNAWWDAQRVGMVPRFIGFLEDVVLSECQGSVVIFVDEIDVTLSLPFSDDFFAAIRALHNARAQNPIFDRLTFVLAGVAAPTDLIKDRTRTPFNVGQGLPLQDFSRTDAERLQKGLEETFLNDAESLFTHIYQWTDGHPYLTQKLCQALIEQQPEHCSNNEIDELVERLFLSERTLKEDNLKFVQDKLLNHPQQRRLLTLYRQIYGGKQLSDDPQSLIQTELKLSGLVKTEQGQLKVRNEIYRHVFDLAWIKAHTAIDWVRWVATVAVLLVVVLSGLLAQSTWAGFRDRDIRAEFHEADTTAPRKIELLHELFGLQAYVPAQDYDEQAKETFYSLLPAEQAALFALYSGEDEPLFVVVDELRTTLADVQDDGSTQPVLEAMRNAVGRTKTKPKEGLKEQLDDWVAAQDNYHNGKREEALDYYTRAFEQISEPNPAILFERARLLAKFGREEEALQDFEQVLAIAENEKPLRDDATPTTTPSPTSTPEPSATPTIANTPSTSSPPTETEEGGNEASPSPKPTATPSPSPLPTEPPLPPNTAQFYTADRMRRAESEFILDHQDNQGLINFLKDAPDSQYPLLRSVITFPFPVVLADTPIPQPLEAISQANVGELTELARWAKGTIRKVAYSPDGKLLGVAASTGISLYDAQTLEELRFIETGAFSIAFSPDGQQIASAAVDKTVRLWRVSDGQLLNTLEGHLAEVRSVAFSPDGKLLASGSVDQTVRLWQVSNGDLLDTLVGHTVTVWSLAFSPDSKLLASGSWDGTVGLWRVSDGELLKRLEGHSGIVWSVAFSPDGQQIASASYDKTVRLWQVSDGELLKTLEGHTNTVSSVAFSPDGQQIASASFDQTVRLWSTEGELLKTFKDNLGNVGQVLFSPDGQQIATESNSQMVHLWRVSDGELLKTLEGDSGGVSSVALSADGQLLASGSRDHMVRLWQVSDGQPLNPLEGHSNWIQSVALSPDGQLLVSASDDRTVRLWRVSDRKQLNTLEGALEGDSAHVLSVAFSTDGQQIASGSVDGAVRLWRVSDGQLLNTLEHSAPVWSVAFSPDGKQIASGSRDRTVRLWSTEGELLNTLKGHLDEVTSVAFSADGQQIASGSSDGTVRLWRVSDGQPLNTLEGHSDWVTSVAFSADGQLLVSGSDDGTIRLWGVRP